MLKISRYKDISKIESESKKDYFDRHTPFIICEDKSTKGVPFKLTVQVGQEFGHPDDFDHYISSISLYNKGLKVSETNFAVGTQGGQDQTGHQNVTLELVLNQNAKLVAQSSCTKHGLWESEQVEIEVN